MQAAQPNKHNIGKGVLILYWNEIKLPLQSLLQNEVAPRNGNEKQRRETMYRYPRNL
jgi:hypothetical protein